MSRIRLAIEGSLTDGDVAALVWDLGWDIVKLIPRDGTNGKKVYYRTEDNIFICFVEDSFLSLPWLEVYGENHEEVLAVIGEIEEKVPCYKLPEILSMIENPKDREELTLGIRYLGISQGFQPFNETVFNTIERLGLHPDLGVRSAAIIASGYICWPEFVPWLSGLAANDPDPELRDYAVFAVDAFRRAGESES